MPTDKEKEGDQSYLMAVLAEVDKRSGQRSDFDCTQRIAPRYHGRTPVPREFFTVKCRDLSTGGISFTIDWEPDFDDLVVALGPDHLTARVVRVSQAYDESGLVYLLGCQFTGRIHI